MDNRLGWKRVVAGCAIAWACGGKPPVDPAHPYDLNDVSYLYPLPGTVAGADALLKFDSAGSKGALLPRPLFDQVKKIDEVLTADAIYSGMRIISARVDPCFPTNKPPEPLACAKQIRLVAQIIEEKDGQVSTRDGTLHLFFNMTDAEWPNVLAGVEELKGLAGDATQAKPLDTHPVMKTQGLAGAYARRLNQLITDFCGDQNLVRVAFMVAGMDGKNWNFGAFKRTGAVMEADVIPRTTDKNEQAQQEHGTETRRNTELIPTPPNIDLTTLLSDTELQLADDFTLNRAVKEALKIESPEKETPQTIDCGSCHAASRALTTAVSERHLDLSTFTDRYVPPSRFNVSRVDEAGTDPFAQRAFGYFGAKTALSQRTINESAAIADALTPK